MIQTYYDLVNMFFMIFSVLSLGAMAGLLSERTGIINIAIEGQMIIGALVFAIAGMNGLPIIVALLLAVIGGVLISLIHGFTTIKLKATHVISGLAINFLAGGIAPFVVLYVSNGKAYISTGYPPLRFAFSGIFSMINWYVIITLILMGIAYFVINKTRAGIRFISAGENPSALLSSGVSANKQRWLGLILSGSFAGLAGAFFTPVISNLFRGSMYGMGYVSLAVLIFGQWRIKFVIAASAIFSIFTATAHYNLPIMEWLPTNFQKMLPFVISLLALVVFSKTSKTPRALGEKPE